MADTDEQAWFACEEHIEVVLDQIVDEEGVAPDLALFADGDDREDAACRWCGGRPVYRLSP